MKLSVASMITPVDGWEEVGVSGLNGTAYLSGIQHTESQDSDQDDEEEVKPKRKVKRARRVQYHV